MEPTASETFEIKIPLHAKMVERIESLVSSPEFGFESAEHLIIAAVFSFVGYKEKMRTRLRRELEEARVSAHSFEKQGGKEVEE